MIRLAALENPRVAQAFIDYMASRHIQILMLPEGNGQFALWIKEDEHQVETEAEFALFLSEPTHEKYQAASWDIASTNTLSQPQFSYHSPNFISLLKARAGPFTLLMMLLCSVIFGLQSLGLGQKVFDALHFPALVSEKWQLWRWLSHAVLHFSATHIIFNLLWWWQLGGDIEKKLGSAKLMQIFVLSAAVSGAAQFWVGGANFGGLSGVVYALLGYLWIVGWRAPDKGVSVPKPIVVFMLVWLVLGFIQPFMAIANSAHLAGLFSGCLLGFLEGKSPEIHHYNHKNQ